MLEVMSKSQRLQRCGSLKRLSSSPRAPTSAGIEFDQVNVIAPSGKLLARELTFQVCISGQALVVLPVSGTNAGQASPCTLLQLRQASL